MPVNLDILSLKQLSVFEGEKVLLSRDNIDIVMDVARYGMEDNGIKMIVITPPAHGTISQETRVLERNSSFTLRDVHMDKVTTPRYVQTYEPCNFFINTNIAHFPQQIHFLVFARLNEI